MKEKHSDKRYSMCTICAIENSETPENYFFANLRSHRNEEHKLDKLGLDPVDCEHCQERLSDGVLPPNWKGHMKSGKCTFSDVCKFCLKFLEKETLTEKWEIKKINTKEATMRHYKYVFFHHISNF